MAQAKALQSSGTVGLFLHYINGLGLAVLVFIVFRVKPFDEVMSGYRNRDSNDELSEKIHNTNLLSS